MRTVGIIAMLALSGCSLVFMETLPANHTPQQEPRCTTSKGWALWDALIMGANVAAGIGTYVQSERLLGDYDEDDPRDEDDIDDIKKTRNNLMLLSGAVAITYGASMVYGIRQASKCEEARAARDAVVRQSAPTTPPPSPGSPSR